LDPPRATPIVFGPTEAQLFGWYHQPHPDKARSTAVVLCNPLGYEGVCAHRTYRHLAERLADAGFVALRFDYHGTGDSAGHAHDPGRVDAWRESVGRAIEDARARSGARAICLFGVRMGATIAATVAAERGGVDSLVLWAVSPNGKSYLRDVRVVGRATDPALASDSTDDVEAGGFVLSRETVGDLPRLDAMTLARPPAQRALVIARASISGQDERLVQALEALGTRTKLASFEGYAGMMLDPHESTVPSEVIEGVARWLSEAHASAPGDVHLLREARRDEPLLRTLSPAAPAKRVLERPVRFGEGERLFGIMTEPEGRAERSNVGVILPSLGAIHRIGAGRFHVSLARKLAPSGVTSFRIDLSGIGDSAPPRGQAENELFAPSAITDVQAAMDYLARSHGLSRFALVGFCSGAYAAYKAATVDPRTAGLVIVNMPTFHWKLGDAIGAANPRTIKSTGHYWRVLFRRETWRRLAQGEIRVRNIAAVLAERMGSLAAARAKDLVSIARGDPAGSETKHALSAMCARGTEVLAVYSHEDPGIHQAELHLGRAARLLRDDPRFQLEIIEESDHTFAQREAQGRLTKRLMAYFHDRIGVE
jgi:alpha/beta superfamily hydrolase